MVVKVKNQKDSKQNNTNTEKLDKPSVSNSILDQEESPGPINSQFNKTKDYIHKKSDKYMSKMKKMVISFKKERNISKLLFGLKLLVAILFIFLGMKISTKHVGYNAGDSFNRFLTFLLDPRIPMILLKLLIITTITILFSCDSIFVLRYALVLLVALVSMCFIAIISRKASAIYDFFNGPFQYIVGNFMECFSRAQRQHNQL